MGRKIKKKTILSTPLPIPDVKKEITPTKKPIQYHVTYPKKDTNIKPFNFSVDDILSNDVYIITCKDERWDYMEKVCKKNGFKKLNRFNAYNCDKHQDLNEFDNALNMKYNGDKKIKQHHAVTQDHILLYLDMLRTNKEYLYVMEDDCVFSDDFKNEFTKYLEHTPKDFDILYLGCQPDFNRGCNKIHSFSDTEYIASVPSFCTHNYIITRKGVIKFFNLVKNLGYTPIDSFLIDRCSQKQLIHYEFIRTPDYSHEVQKQRSIGLVGQTTDFHLNDIPEEIEVNIDIDSVKCYCGKVIKKKGFEKHRKTRKHINYFNDIEGWCCQEKEEDLFTWINKMNCKSGLEIGVFGGSSLIRAGLMFKDNKGHLVGIDPYCFIDSNKYDTKNTENYNWWKELDYDNIYNGCLNSLSRYNLKDTVNLIKMNSDDYCKKIPDKCLDFLHIDGNHTEEQSCLDVKNYLPKCKNGCVIFLDDIGWESVHRARDMLRKRCKMIKETIQEDTGNSWGIYLLE